MEGRVGLESGSMEEMRRLSWTLFIRKDALAALPVLPGALNFRASRGREGKVREGRRGKRQQLKVPGTGGVPQSPGFEP